MYLMQTLVLQFIPTPRSHKYIITTKKYIITVPYNDNDTLEITIYKSSPNDAADITDFETNYKDDCNVFNVSKKIPLGI